MFYRKVLIYDFGGGTFDVAVINVEKAQMNVMAVGGDNHLGGDDFDNKLLEYCLSEFHSQTGYKVTNTDAYGVKALSRLRRECEELKCKLSATQTANISLDGFYQSQDLRALMSLEISLKSSVKTCLSNQWIWSHRLSKIRD